MVSPATDIVKNNDHLMKSVASKNIQTNGKPMDRSHHDKSPKNGGVMIVLTASKIEMNDFNLNPYLAFSGGFPPILPTHVAEKKLYGPIRFNDDGTAKFAPYGLRKVEALLIEEFGEENVATVHPQSLHEFIGPKTKVVGISTMDPLGIGFVSRTYTSILGLYGKSTTHIEFEKLLSDPVFRKDKPIIIVGGSGAWQISSANMQDELGIDTILIGKSDKSVIEVFWKALASKKNDRIITMEASDNEKIPNILNPSLYGAVEITRGCGRGCAFCSATMPKLYSFPLERILKEVKLNAENGTEMILLETDDIFLYKSKQNFIPNREAVSELIQSIEKVKGVRYIQIAHTSLAPIVYDKKIVEEIAPALVEKSVWNCQRKRCASIEIGVETGSTRLMKKFMKGKMLPYKPEQWQEVVVQAIGTLNDNGIYPLATLILGLPEEQEEDVQATLEMLDKLKGAKIYYVPLLFTSEEESVLKKHSHKDLKDLYESQWDIISICWRNNIDLWYPELSYFASIGSLLAFPYLRLKHGRQISRPLMNFGLESLLRDKKSEKSYI